MIVTIRNLHFHFSVILLRLQKCCGEVVLIKAALVATEKQTCTVSISQNFITVNDYTLRESSSTIFCLLSSSFGLNSYEKEFVPLAANSFKNRPLLERLICSMKQPGSHNCCFHGKNG